MKRTISKTEMDRIMNADHHDPFSILGMHRVNMGGDPGPCIAVRVFIPDASTVTIIPEERNGRYDMEKIGDTGFFEAVIDERNDFFRYKRMFDQPFRSQSQIFCFRYVRLQ